MAWMVQGEKTYRQLFYLLIVLGFVYFFYLVRGLLFSFVLAVIITYLLNPVVNAIDRRGASRLGAILLTYLALFFVLSGIFLYGVPRIIEQLNRLSEDIPVYTNQIHEIIQSIQGHYTSLEIPEGMRQVIDERIHWLEEHILQVVREVIEVLLGTVGYVFKILLAPVLAFYFLKDLELIKQKTILLVPESARGEIHELFKEIDKVIGSFLRGYFIVAAVVGGMTAITLALLGVDFALMLGLFAGLTELIPYFGPVIGAVPAVSLAILKSKWLAVKVALAFLIIHQLEGNIISPKIYSDKVGLHPLAVIFSLMAGGELYGLTGMLLAVPAAAVGKVVVRFLYRKVEF